VLHEPSFQDAAPAEVSAQLLDEGRHLGSERTLYRELSEKHPVRERRNPLRHPSHPVPSQDTRLRGVKLTGPACGWNRARQAPAPWGRTTRLRGYGPTFTDTGSDTKVPEEG